ncbi:MAG: DUF4271 domain-containing protein [Chitinophagaceae bacterium]
MKHFFHLILFFSFFAETVSAQTPVDSASFPSIDSTNRNDTVVVKDSLLPAQAVDSFSMRPRIDSEWSVSRDISVLSSKFGWQVLNHHPYFGFKEKPIVLPQSDIRQIDGKELLFYLLVFLLLVFALLRQLFPKYFADLFRLFFRTTLKQRQIRDQLMQTPLPSLLLNGFFVVNAGLYITFLLQYFKLNPVDNFWLLFLYCCLGLSAAYFVKFIGLKVSGWLFSMGEAADSYIFIVFIVNKMIGILLLPFLVLLAFSADNVYSISMTISWCLVAGLFAYRFILTYVAIRNQVKVNPFHFFLYLLAFEIAPLLLVYKGLLLFFSRTA